MLALVYIAFLLVKVVSYMQHVGRGMATKVDENVAKWRKICRNTVPSLRMQQYEGLVL